MMIYNDNNVSLVNNWFIENKLQTYTQLIVSNTGDLSTKAYTQAELKIERYKIIHKNNTSITL